jgi:hypothetical protein
MFHRPRHLRRGYFLLVATLLTVLVGVFAAGLLFGRDNNTVTAAPFFAPCSAPCFENFDNVTVPSLPSSWTRALNTGQPGDPTWMTVNNVSDSAPNSAFVSGPGHVADNWLTSRRVGITSSQSVLSFRRQHKFENGFDGMVLEISFDGQSYGDIIAAGASFVSGGYNGTISPSFASPIAGRMAWTGDSGGFVTTTINLGNAASFSTIWLRWRVASDSSVASPGAFIDSMTLTNFGEAPANDDYANAQPFLGVAGVVTGSNVGATKELDEPNIAGVTGVGSIWFKWQAPDTGTFVFTTFGSSTDTLLGFYTGNTLATAVPVPGGANDDEGFGCFGILRESGLALNAIGGTVYHIVVARKSGTANGSITLRWGRRASISGRITDASTLDPSFAETIHLSMNGSCYRRGEGGILSFQNIPADTNYSVFVASPSSPNFTPWPGNPSISPLRGTVTNYNVYKASPTKSIKGTIRIPNGDTSNITVTCVSTPGGLISFPATDLGLGGYQCSGLPVEADYIVTPSKLGYTFACQSINPTCHTSFYRFNNLIGDIIFADFDGTLAPTRTISGRITQPDGTTGISGVTVGLIGPQIKSTVTNATGNYSFTGLLQGGNYTVTPANPNLAFTPPSLSFTNLSSDPTANFTATFLLQLILDDAGQVAAVDSMLLLRDPFRVLNPDNLLNRGVDRNTRVTIFLSNFQLGPTEPSSAVVINLVGSDNQTYNIPAEDVRSMLGLGFTQVIFRLPDTLTAGTCTLALKAHGLTSNMGVMRIRN